MEGINEKINYENPMLSIKTFQAHREPRKESPHITWHYHKEIEMLAVLSGEMDVYVEDSVYSMKPGNVTLIGKHQVHTDKARGRERMEYICIQFDIEQYFDQGTMPYFKYFSETKRPLSDLNYILKENETVRDIIFNCVKDIYLESTAKKQGYEIAVNVQIQTIILTLLRNDTRKVLDYKDDADLKRLRPVLDYVEQNIDEKILVEEASRIANVSYYYFVKYFKKVLGISFTEYVNYRKIKKAERILLTKDMSISQVGEAIGMPNMAHFYKVFKKFNECSPNEFRKKMYESVK